MNSFKNPFPPFHTMAEKYNIILRQRDGHDAWASYRSRQEFERVFDELQGEVLETGVSIQRAIDFCKKQDNSKRILRKEVIIGQTFYFP